MKHVCVFLAIVCLSLSVLCGCDLSYNKSTNTCQHDYVIDETDRVEAVCGQDGYQAYVCSLCGNAKKEPVFCASDEHVLNTNRVSVKVKATCTTDGAGGYNCRYCSYYEPVDISSPGHQYVWNTVEATCTQDGFRSGVCSVCADKKSEVLTCEGHTYVWSPFKVATCKHAGQEKGVCSRCKEVTYRTIDQLEHSYDWVIVKEATFVATGEKQYRCKTCSDVKETVYLPALNNALPCLYLTGDYTAASRVYEAPLTAVYVDKDGEEVFNCYATIKWQGGTSSGYPKKNYTMKLYKTDAYGDGKKQKVDLGWGKESKYCLKANYIDYTQARNISACRLWGEMVGSRVSSVIQARLAALPTNGGAVDGYPILVFMNGNFHGLYTLNVPKDDWMLGMGDAETEALVMATGWDTKMDKVLDKAFALDGEGDLMSGQWDLKYYGTEKTTGDCTWVKNSLNNLITFLSTSSDADFKAHASEYIDIDACIDYMILFYALNMRDNCSKNMLWATYDGVVWFPTVYDQDATYGMVWDGIREGSTTEQIMTVKNGVAEDGMADQNAHVVWNRILKNFPEKLYDRYVEVRQTTLSDAHILSEIKAFIDQIPQTVFDLDRQMWPNAGDTKFKYSYIEAWVPERMANVDDAFEKLYNEVLHPTPAE